MYIIPNPVNEIAEFKVHPNTGEFYWSIDNAAQYGLFHYSQGSVIQDVWGYVYSIAFDSNGDLFYGFQNDLKDDQGNTVYAAPHTIEELEYDAGTNSFFMSGSDYISNSNAGVIWFTGSSSIQDISLNQLTSEVLYVSAGAIGIVDYSGGNHHVINVTSNFGNSLSLNARFSFHVVILFIELGLSPNSLEKLYVGKFPSITIFIFLTPDVHNIRNSFSWICLTINIINDSKKAKGMNFVKMPNKFNNEYWK